MAGRAAPAGLVAQQRVDTARAPGAVLRALDKVSGQSIDLEIGNGRSAQFGSLDIAVIDCRYPAGNRTGDAFAGLRIVEGSDAVPVFEGWMIASAPALSALDHPRYDVWVIRCITS
jgi:hypothetical protein